MAQITLDTRPVIEGARKVAGAIGQRVRSYQERPKVGPTPQRTTRIRYETVYVFEEPQAHSVELPVEELRKWVDRRARDVPDSIAAGIWGAIIGGGVCGLIIFVVVWSQLPPQFAGMAAVFAGLPIGLILGWPIGITFFSPKPEWQVRRTSKRIVYPVIHSSREPIGPSIAPLIQKNGAASNGGSAKMPKGMETVIPHNLPSSVLSASFEMEDLTKRDERLLFSGGKNLWHKLAIGGVMTLLVGMVIMLVLFTIILLGEQGA